MRKYMFQLALTATLWFAIPAGAQQRTVAQQQFPGRPMPPDIVAPADSHHPPAPKPERNALPQSDQPAKAATHQPPSQALTPTQPQKPGSKARKHPAKPSPVPTPEPVAQAPAPPPPPPTPQQMPPSAPQVQYVDGLLTISANNSTLLDVLNAVGARTGATVTAPPAASAARLFLQIGPAPPRDVLSRILAGTNLDYLLAGSPDDPNALRQVIITQRQGGPAVAQNPNPPRQSPLPGMANQASQDDDDQPVQQPQPQQGMPGGFVAPGGVAPGGPGPFQPNPANAPPNVANPTPFSQTPGPTGVAPVQPPSQPPQQPPGQVKTPEQLLQEIRQMQQRQQQQQQKPPQ